MSAAFAKKNRFYPRPSSPLPRMSRGAATAAAFVAGVLTALSILALGAWLDA